MVITMSGSKSPLAKLVLFMACLSVAGAFVAGVHYFVIDQPQQNMGPAPANSYDNFDMECMKNCQVAYSNCLDDYYACIGPNCGPIYQQCQALDYACMIPCGI